MKPLIYTNHALERMEERGIRPEAVSGIVLGPHIRLPRNGAAAGVDLLQSAGIRVAVARNPAGQCIILTAMLAEEAW